MASSVALPSPRIGQILPGKHWQYKLTKQLPCGWGVHDVFKAKVLGDSSRRAPKWAAIKTACEGLQDSLIREKNEYLKPHVSSCQSIRPLLDVITTVEYDATMRNGFEGLDNPPPYLAFPWMELNLWDITEATHKKDIVLFEAVVTGVLQALVPFEMNNRVHGCIMGDQVFLNRPQPGKYEVMLGGLGSAEHNGFNDDEPLGPPGLRAPEVHEGKGYYHCSDIWALGMLLLEHCNWPAFAYEPLSGEYYIEEETIAQLMQIYPDWIPEPVEGKTYGERYRYLPLQEMFDRASVRKPLVLIPSLKQQLKDMEAPKELKDMLRVLLSLKVERRLSASMVLQSPEYQALRKVAHN